MRLVKLRYTAKAADDLEHIINYLLEQSPQGARKVLARIHTLTNLLRQRPYIGRRIGVQEIRRLPIRPYPYLIFYEPKDDEIIIHRVRHGARNPATMLSGE